MKKLFLLFLITSSIYADKSIYPLPYTFNDEGFYIEAVLHEEVGVMSFSLATASDEYLHIQTGFRILNPKCEKITTMDKLLAFDEKKENTKCYKLFKFYHNEIIEQINIEDFKIIVYTNKNFEFEQTAIISYKNQLIATIIYHSYDKNFDKFYTILKSIEKNKNIQNIKYYLEEISMTNSSAKNTRLKYLVSAQLAGSSNEELRKYFEEILLSKRNSIMINEMYLKK